MPRPVLVDALREDVDDYVLSDRHHASVLNSEYPTAQASRLLADLESGLAIVERTNPRHFEVADELVYYPVFVEGKIVYGTPDNQGEFAGWFIGEEYYGLSHPLLLLEPTRVFERVTEPQPPPIQL